VFGHSRLFERLKFSNFFLCEPAAAFDDPYVNATAALVECMVGTSRNFDADEAKWTAVNTSTMPVDKYTACR
jgi:hypothetical protein